MRDDLAEAAYEYARWHDGFLDKLHDEGCASAMALHDALLAREAEQATVDEQFDEIVREER